jgi:sialic acid synthase SpsE
VIILDMGAGDAHHNDIEYIKEIMAELPAGVVVKFQLFKDIPGLTPMTPSVFMKAQVFGQERGIDVTASAFCSESLELITKLVKVPFVKIACRPELYPMIDEIPLTLPVVVSIDSHPQLMAVATEHMQHPIAYMCCVPKYPATMDEYWDNFTHAMLGRGVSDHTIGLELFQDHKPQLYERHLDYQGPDEEWSVTTDDVHWMLAKQREWYEV